MSRFVSEGSEYKPPSNDAAWSKAQEEVQALRKPKERVQEEDSRTLYEVLQANKAAKQAEFEESIRLKNQFRALDEDDIAFLDSVHEASRAKDAAARRETAEQIDAFRKQQEAAEKATIGVSSDAASALADKDTEAWTRKRRRREPDTVIAKARKLSTAKFDHQEAVATSPQPSAELVSGKAECETKDQLRGSNASAEKPSELAQEVRKPSALGLDEYSSDDG